VGFDELSVDAQGQPDAPSEEPFQPSVGNCIDADEGPFVEAARELGQGYGVFVRPPYVLMAVLGEGLRALSVEDGAFRRTGQLDLPGQFFEAIVGDDQALYGGVPGYGLVAVRIDADGSLALIDENRTDVVQARRSWLAGGRVYVPSGNEGLHAFTLEGTQLVEVGTPIASQSWGQAAWATGNRVIFADGAALRLVDFDGTTFTDVMAPLMDHTNYNRLWSDGTVVFAATDQGVVAYRMGGASLSELALFPTAEVVRDVWSDGQHIFVAAQGDGFYALAFDGTAFTELDHLPSPHSLGVFGDGTYIYLNDRDDGLRAMSGFRCTITQAE
jgi:hypothetical protein